MRGRPRDLANLGNLANFITMYCDERYFGLPFSENEEFMSRTFSLSPKFVNVLRSTACCKSTEPRNWRKGEEDGVTTTPVFQRKSRDLTDICMGTTWALRLSQGKFGHVEIG
jgi:hypothetical protein